LDESVDKTDKSGIFGTIPRIVILVNNLLTYLVESASEAVWDRGKSRENRVLRANSAMKLMFISGW
jgi:hypothetical protein